MRYFRHAKILLLISWLLNFTHRYKGHLGIKRYSSLTSSVGRSRNDFAMGFDVTYVYYRHYRLSICSRYIFSVSDEFTISCWNVLLWYIETKRCKIKVVTNKFETKRYDILSEKVATGTMGNASFDGNFSVKFVFRTAPNFCVHHQAWALYSSCVQAFARSRRQLKYLSTKII